MMLLHLYVLRCHQTNFVCTAITNMTLYQETVRYTGLPKRRCMAKDMFYIHLSFRCILCWFASEIFSRDVIQFMWISHFRWYITNVDRKKINTKIKSIRSLMYKLVMNTFFFVSKNKTFPFDYIKFRQKQNMCVILFSGAGQHEL